MVLPLEVMLGVLGGVAFDKDVAVAVLLAGEFPTPFTARIRKLYEVFAVSPITVTVVVEAPDLDTVVQAAGHLVAVESLY